MNEETRYCRKCLLRDMDKQTFFKSLKERIDSIDEDLKVENSVYEERLACCKACERLLDGMCKACGCYVELRAVMKKNSCPYDHWGAVKVGDRL